MFPLLIRTFDLQSKVLLVDTLGKSGKAERFRSEEQNKKLRLLFCSSLTYPYLCMWNVRMMEF